MIGYPGRNNTLREQTPPVRCNRGMQKKTWNKRGIEYAGELAEKNFRDLLKILKWNYDNGIKFYRCTSQSFVPWNSHYELEDLPNYSDISKIAQDCGQFIRRNNMRLSFHPDYFVKPASNREETRENSRTSLENHGSWLDLMELPQSNKFPINIHVGGHYGDMDKTAERFISFMDTVSDSVSSRLVVENDDRPSLWSVEELVEDIHKPTGCSITFDYHHHSLSSKGNTYREAFKLASETWNRRPVTHYSEPAILFNKDDAKRPQAHASYVSRVPEWLRDDSDVMLECDGKEKAVLEIQGREIA